jgi:ABC-type Na+ transport system ATPase subunit NatA
MSRQAVARVDQVERGGDLAWVPPSTGDIAIQIDGLKKSYAGIPVLGGVDLAIERGTIVALLGSNGAGKTTLVNILSTLLKADAGSARVNSFDVATQADRVRESISLTGQFAAVDEVLSGHENMVLMARLRHLKETAAIADELLSRFALTDAASRRVATYSGGMRRRLDIAMSLIGNPPVIFLDEPTTGLDPQGRLGPAVAQQPRRSGRGIDERVDVDRSGCRHRRRGHDTTAFSSSAFSSSACSSSASSACSSSDSTR